MLQNQISLKFIQAKRLLFASVPWLLLAFLLAALLWLWVDSNVVYKPPPVLATADTPGAPATTTAPTAGNGGHLLPEPPYLAIPKIGVVAPVQAVGVTADGNMDVPTNASAVGWYKQGPWPGSSGSAVLAGHVNSDYGRTAGVFWDLQKLRTGDEVQFVDRDGSVLTFRVWGRASYAPDDAPLEEIFGYRSGRHLNLITCEGRWDPLTRSYSHRLVVFTELVETE